LQSIGRFTGAQVEHFIAGAGFQVFNQVSSALYRNFGSRHDPMFAPEDQAMVPQRRYRRHHQFCRSGDNERQHCDALRECHNHLRLPAK
jgi:hypothetical protein